MWVDTKEMGEGGRKEGEVKRIKVCFAHEPTSHDELIITYTNAAYFKNKNVKSP